MTTAETNETKTEPTNDMISWTEMRTESQRESCVKLDKRVSTWITEDIFKVRSRNNQEMDESSYGRTMTEAMAHLNSFG